jgi:nuclear transport factor 2 (NTF2) superfamily protein
LAEDITEALHKAIAAERRAFALKRAADPMGRGRTSPAEIKKFDGLMRRRIASINDLPISTKERKYHWPLGSRPDDHPSLSELGL